MAGNNSIQFVRGTSSQRASCTETSLAGQPIYETDTNRLYVGNGETSVNDLTAVKASAADSATNAGHATTADSATNVTDQIDGKAISSIFEDDGTTVKKATDADNVKSQINDQNITDIFEVNGTTVKKATKLATARNMQVDLASGNSQAFDGSADAEEIGVAGVLPVANGGTGASNLNNIKVGSAGSADRAAKLSAARNLQVNVASGNAQSFDGSGNATDIGVKGVLPVANGGTGQNNLDNVTVGNAKSATSATDANNVRSTINDKAITAIFENDGVTVRKATTIGKYQHNISVVWGGNGKKNVLFSFIDETKVPYTKETLPNIRDFFTGIMQASGYSYSGIVGESYKPIWAVRISSLSGLIDLFYTDSGGTPYSSNLSTAQTFSDKVVDL